MCQSQLAAATYLGLLLLAQFVRLIAEQFSPILLEPDCKSLSFFRCQIKNRVFQLFQAHGIQSNKPEPAGEPDFHRPSAFYRFGSITHNALSLRLIALLLRT